MRDAFSLRKALRDVAEYDRLSRGRSLGSIPFEKVRVEIHLAESLGNLPYRGIPFCFKEPSHAFLFHQ